MTDVDSSDTKSQAATSVYCYHDRDGALIYVGITGRNTKRQDEHNRTQMWWPFVHRQRVLHFGTRHEARAREVALIHAYNPPFNVQDNPFPWADEYVRRIEMRGCEPTGITVPVTTMKQAERVLKAGGAGRRGWRLPLEIVAYGAQRGEVLLKPQLGEPITSIRGKALLDITPCLTFDKTTVRVLNAKGVRIGVANIWHPGAGFRIKATNEAGSPWASAEAVLRLIVQQQPILLGIDRIQAATL